MDRILVLDFGGQYNQLIARRVRSEQVYAEIKPYNKITPEEIKVNDYKGIIFTGGPNSVYDEASPHYDSAILNLGISSSISFIFSVPMSSSEYEKSLRRSFAAE